MRKLLAAILLAASTITGAAITPQQFAVLFGNTPSWVLPGAALACDFAGSRYFNCSVLGNFLLTRASSGYAQDQSGLWILFGGGVPRITNKGWLIEVNATNSALWARDMTTASSASWAKVTTTAALNAVGIDGVANSATTLTATGAVSTILQTVAIAAGQTYSVFLKGVTVTGAVSITVNGGVGTTACTVATGDTQFTRCQVAGAGLNPIFGIVIANSGDVVVADFNQLEAASNIAAATSPITTTTAAATRNSDIITLVGLPLALVQGVTGAFVYQTTTGYLANTGATRVLGITGGVASLGLGVNTASTTVLRSTDSNNGNAITATLGSGATTGAHKGGVSWGAASRALVGNAGTVATSAAPFTAGGVVTAANLGSTAGATQPNGYIGRIDMFAFTPPNPTLQAFTRP